MNLAVIQEELHVEEGCENELENNRMTLQMIRQKTSKNNGVASVEGDEERKLAEEDNTEMQISGLEDDQFAHLEEN